MLNGYGTPVGADLSALGNPTTYPGYFVKAWLQMWSTTLDGCKFTSLMVEKFLPEV
jgi:hypothetical protein